MSSEQAPEQVSLEQIKWPEVPFYLRSCLADHSWALRPLAGIVINPKWETFAPSAAQLWTTSPTGTGGSVLVNLGGIGFLNYQPNALQYNMNPDGTLKNYWVNFGDLDASNPGLGWLRVKVGDAADSPSTIVPEFLRSNRINVPHSDVKQGIQIFPNDGKAPPSLNEQFMIVEEQGQFVTTGDPIYSSMVKQGDNVVSGGDTFIVDNSAQASTPATAHVTLSYTESTSTTITQSTSKTDSTTKTLSLKVGGVIKKILSIDVEGSISQTTSTTVTMETSKEQTSSETFSIEYDASVPAGKKYKYQIQTGVRGFSADMSVPVMVYSSIPGAKPYPLTVSAKYLGSNTTGSVLVVSEVKKIPNDSSNDSSYVEEIVERIPLSAVKRTKLSSTPT